MAVRCIMVDFLHQYHLWHRFACCSITYGTRGYRYDADAGGIHGWHYRRIQWWRPYSMVHDFRLHRSWVHLYSILPIRNHRLLVFITHYRIILIPSTSTAHYHLLRRWLCLHSSVPCRSIRHPPAQHHPRPNPHRLGLCGYSGTDACEPLSRYGLRICNGVTVFCGAVRIEPYRCHPIKPVRQKEARYNHVRGCNRMRFYRILVADPFKYRKYQDSYRLVCCNFLGIFVFWAHFNKPKRFRIFSLN